MLINLHFPVASTFSFLLIVLAIWVLHQNEKGLSLTSFEPQSWSISLLDPPDHLHHHPSFTTSPSKIHRDRGLLLPCLPSPCIPHFLSLFSFSGVFVLLLLSSSLKGKGVSQGSILSPLHFTCSPLITHRWQSTGASPERHSVSVCEVSLTLIHAEGHPYKRLSNLDLHPTTFVDHPLLP